MNQKKYMVIGRKSENENIKKVYAFITEAESKRAAFNRIKDYIQSTNVYEKVQIYFNGGSAVKTLPGKEEKGESFNLKEFVKKNMFRESVRLNPIEVVVD